MSRKWQSMQKRILRKQTLLWQMPEWENTHLTTCTWSISESREARPNAGMCSNGASLSVHVTLVQAAYCRTNCSWRSEQESGKGEMIKKCSCDKSEGASPNIPCHHMNCDALIGQPNINSSSILGGKCIPSMYNSTQCVQSTFLQPQQFCH